MHLVSMTDNIKTYPILPYEAGSYSKGGQQNPSHHRSACLPIDGKDLPEYQYLRFFLPESTTYVRNLSGSQVIVFENKVKKGCFLRSGNLFQDQWQALFICIFLLQTGKFGKVIIHSIPLHRPCSRKTAVEHGKKCHRK